MSNASREHRNTLWWHTAAQKPSLAPLAAHRHVRVAIIGGGFTGMTAAMHLAARGIEVTVLEADEIGSGASGLNAGFVVPNFAKADPAYVLSKLGTDRGRRLLNLVGQGADRVFSTIGENGIDCDPEQVGWMHVAHSDAMLKVLQQRVAAWNDLGRPLRLLSAAEARELTGVRHCAGALLDPSGGMLHPLNYLYGLAKSALRSGATIHENTLVAAVERSKSSWVLSCGTYTVSADRVLLCTNASPLGAAGRLYRAIVPLPVYQISTKPLPKDVVSKISSGRNPVADTRANLFTYRLDRSDRLISGGMAIVPIRAHERMGRMIVERLFKELSLPVMPEIEHVWRGTAAITPDFMPHLYEFGPGFIGGIGCNGRGIAMTAMLGQVMAAAAAGEPLRDLPIPLASERAVPFHRFARAAPSFAIAQARWADRRDHL
jgi:glycine/D-amino acid oxidase-like deaminating enzyme